MGYPYPNFCLCALFSGAYEDAGARGVSFARTCRLPKTSELTWTVIAGWFRFRVS